MACTFFAPFFTAVYILERLELQTIYVLNKEVLKSAVYNQKRVIMQIITSVTPSIYGNYTFESIFHQFQGFRQAYKRPDPLRAIPSICNQRFLVSSTLQFFHLEISIASSLL